MANKPNRHLSEEELLRYADGEIPESQSWIARHLLACWQCRARLSDLEATIKTIVQFRNDDFLPAIPEPPKPWDSLQPRLRSQTAGAGSRSLWARIFSGPLHRHRLTTAVGFTALCVFGGLWFLEPRPASASAVLTRAANSESQAISGAHGKVVHQRLRVRKRKTGESHEALLEYGVWRNPAVFRLTQPAAGGPVLHDLEELYQDNHLNWREPLSAIAYSEWRKGLAHSETSVEPRAEEREVTVTTFVSRQPPDPQSIARAEITFRTSDYHAVQERLWTASADYEITETHWDLVEPEALASLRTDSNMQAAKANGGSAKSGTRPPQLDVDLATTEMEIRHALHHLAADLGDPITVGRGPEGDVIVEVLGVRPERLGQIEELLHRYPTVILDRTGHVLRDSQPCDGRAQPPPMLVSSGPATGPEVLVKHFGGQEELQTFSREMLELSAAAMAHAYALRALAMRYDPAAERILSAASVRQLWEMVASHTEAMNDKSSQIETELRPVLHDISLRRDSPPPHSLGTTWQQSAMEVFRQAQNIDRLLKITLTKTNSSDTPADALSRLATELPVERALLAQYRDFVERNTTSK
jgi:hypothetical protein